MGGEVSHVVCGGSIFEIRGKLGRQLTSPPLSRSSGPSYPYYWDNNLIGVDSTKKKKQGEKGL